MTEFPTFKGSQRPWIGSYCIPSCITHRPLPTYQIEETFCGRMDGHLVCSTGLIENSLFVGVIYHESCHSSMHSLNICQKKLSGGILLSVMTEQIPSLAALSAISFPFIPTWLGIQHRLACLPISVSWV